MSNAKHSIYNEVEFDKVVSEMSQEERDAQVAELQAEIDEIIAQKNALKKKQLILEELKNMFLYD